MAFLDVENGHRVYYEHRAGPRRPVLLIHGWGMGCRVWDATIDTLAEAGHATIAFDHRGCGQTDKDFADISIAAIARDAVAIVDRLGLDGLVVNGWSLGGAVATQVASALGKRCNGLVLTCAASPTYNGSPEDIRASEAAYRADRATFLKGLSAAVCAKPVDPAVVDWMWSIFVQQGAGAIRSLHDLGGIDQRDMLAGLSVPVLVFGGTADVIVAPEIAQQAAAAARDAQLVLLEGVGHAPFVEDFDGYHTPLLRFLERLG
jgi:pimeloyl-[acyl-carrier protein] methyl ester esterase